MPEYHQAFCPVCGRAAGTQVINKSSDGVPIIRQNFWEIGGFFDIDKPFGVIQDIGGRAGRGEVLGYFSPEEDQSGFFPLVKERMLRAMAKWVKRGWITRAEISAAIKEES